MSRGTTSCVEVTFRAGLGSKTRCICRGMRRIMLGKFLEFLILDKFLTQEFKLFETRSERARILSGLKYTNSLFSFSFRPVG